MLAIEIIELTKDYGVGFWRKRPRRALERLSLEVEAGEVFGLLGPNGAGKTTTLKILLGLVFPTVGTARLFERDAHDISAHQKVGYLPENPSFYDRLTAKEFMTYAASLFGLSDKARSCRITLLLEQVGLSDSVNLPIRKFSKGMIQRLGIAQALINDPDLIFLDEPMSGLDPVGRREVRNIILQLKEKGKTIFFSTHILSDAETLCDRVAILDHGRLQGCGELREILEMGLSNTEIVLEKPSPDTIVALESFASSVVRTGDRVRLELRAGSDLAKVLAQIVRCNAKLISLNPVRMSLEDYFMERVGNSDGLSSRRGATAGMESRRNE
ncbi:MAG: ABC transporter ATP-binding protein [Acidobacteria bacterium]|nr:ABC transporter ATP-binding protein [Acidobacteriota bacterium]